LSVRVTTVWKNLEAFWNSEKGLQGLDKVFDSHLKGRIILNISQFDDFLFVVVVFCVIIM
jgi:hypothetical protein